MNQKGIIRRVKVKLGFLEVGKGAHQKFEEGF